jgi:glyoxylase-like metal-dependent hydrolase (beta-lactamase superfamily II)
MHVETFPAGPLGCNCSIVADVAAKTAIVVDPGGDFDAIAARLDALGVGVAAIVHTHTHIDHVGATAPLQKKSGAKACIHEADRFLYDLLPVQAAMLGVPLPETADMEGSLVDGATLRAGGFELGVLHTPGHTPGSVSFVLRGAEKVHVFTGDTLFRRGIGRTDLWGGDSRAIERSIQGKLYTLDAGAVVVPGHGDASTIGEEREKNPFVRASA